MNQLQIFADTFIGSHGHGPEITGWDLEEESTWTANPALNGAEWLDEYWGNTKYLHWKSQTSFFMASVMKRKNNSAQKRQLIFILIITCFEWKIYFDLETVCVYLYTYVYIHKLLFICVCNTQSMRQLCINNNLLVEFKNPLKCSLI